MPGASSMRGVTGFRILDAVNGALAQLIPDRVPAAGEGGNTLAIFGARSARDGGERASSSTSSSSAPGAGRRTADGNDGLTNPASLAANIPIEVAESEFPIVVERYGLVPDSGGAGAAPRRPRDRARLALPRRRDTSLIVRSDRADARRRTASRGGGPGRVSATCSLHPDGTRGDRCRRCSRSTIERGRRLRPPDGGRRRLGRSVGERDPAAVADDVAE